MATFDASASQFAGGGFVASQTPEGVSRPRSFEGRQQHTLRALTVAQLRSATPSPDGAPCVDGAPVQNVSLVARICRVEERALMTLYGLEDGTGSISAKLWASGEVEGEDARRAGWLPGTYVHAHGSLAELDGDRILSLLNMRVVEDHNEITYHLAQVIFQHLHTLRTQAGKAAAENAAGGGGAAGGSFGAGAGAGAFLGGANAFLGGGALSAPGSAPASASSGPLADQELVKTILRTTDTAEGEGLTVHDLVERSGGKLTAARAQLAVDALQNEGHIYSGGDTDHFKLCEF